MGEGVSIAVDIDDVQTTETIELRDQVFGVTKRNKMSTFTVPKSERGSGS